MEIPPAGIYVEDSYVQYKPLNRASVRAGIGKSAWPLDLSSLNCSQITPSVLMKRTVVGREYCVWYGTIP